MSTKNDWFVRIKIQVRWSYGGSHLCNALPHLKASRSLCHSLIGPCSSWTSEGAPWKAIQLSKEFYWSKHNIPCTPCAYGIGSPPLTQLKTIGIFLYSVESNTLGAALVHPPTLSVSPPISPSSLVHTLGMLLFPSNGIKCARALLLRRSSVVSTLKRAKLPYLQLEFVDQIFLNLNTYPQMFWNQCGLQLCNRKIF